MVEKFKTILEGIITEKGQITLLALLKMDEFVDKWTVVFCAPWASADNRAEVCEVVKNAIVKNLTSEEISEIGRIGIFPKTEHLVEELLQYKSGASLENQKINGNTVHLAHIIFSNSNA